MIPGAEAGHGALPVRSGRQHPDLRDRVRTVQICDPMPFAPCGASSLPYTATQRLRAQCRAVHSHARIPGRTKLIPSNGPSASAISEIDSLTSPEMS